MADLNQLLQELQGRIQQNQEAQQVSPLAQFLNQIGTSLQQSQQRQTQEQEAVTKRKTGEETLKSLMAQNKERVAKETRLASPPTSVQSESAQRLFQLAGIPTQNFGSQGEFEQATPHLEKAAQLNINMEKARNDQREEERKRTNEQAKQDAEKANKFVDLEKDIGTEINRRVDNERATFVKDVLGNIKDLGKWNQRQKEITEEVRTSYLAAFAGKQPEINPERSKTLKLIRSLDDPMAISNLDISETLAQDPAIRQALSEQFQKATQAASKFGSLMVPAGGPELPKNRPLQPLVTPSAPRR